MQETANFLPTRNPNPSPHMTQIPLLNTVKRKRSESSNGSLYVSPPPKRVMETMSHVEIPPLDLARPPVYDTGQGANGQQASGRAEQEEEITSGSHAVESRNGEAERPVESLRHGGPDGGGSRLTGKRKAVERRVDAMSLRTTIESQFSLEILLKHKELRLIDQELARCQIALEQFRRCQVIPYPALSSTLDQMQAVTAGSGAIYDNTAPHASPWGITNGPYSRHYKRWLMPDPTFDNSIEDQASTSISVGNSVSQRSMRGSTAEKTPYATAHRSQRGSINARLKALPHGYPEPKEEKGPMVVKRSSDGHMVKLVCLDCRRSNFNSAQGFINHCRIAHSRQFLSHDAAIEASGEELDVEVDGGGGEASSAQGSSTAGLVHPLIRSAFQRPAPAEPATLSNRRKLYASGFDMPSSSPNAPDSLITSTPRPQTQRSRNPTEPPPVPFNPSPQTPHLSALLAKLGRGGNLDDMVSEAKTRHDVDLSQLSEEEDDDVERAGVPEETVPSRSTRGILRSGAGLNAEDNVSVLVKASSNSQSQTNMARKPQSIRSVSPLPVYSSAYSVNVQQRLRERDSSMSAKNTPINLSPNTTDPHPAPSLVSDDGDYDNSHSESESTASPGIDEEHDHYMHAEVLDHDEIGLGESSELNLAPSNKPPRSTDGRPPRPSTAIHRDGPDERHVTFAIPARRMRKAPDVTKGR